MLTERNPYDPIEVKWPPFSYWVKAGAAFSFGTAVFGMLLVLTWWVAIGSAFSLLAALTHR